MHKYILVLLLLVAMAPLAMAYDGEDHYLRHVDESDNVSMDLKNTALVDVLRVFSKQSGMNFVAADDIAEKKVTLFLENVPIKEALKRILQAHQLVYEAAPNSNIFIVKAKGEDTQTRVYPLKYATVSTSKLNDAAASSTGSASTSAASSSSSASSATTASTPAPAGGSRNSIVTTLRAIISKQGSIMEDARTNSLIITDIPRQFPVIEATIARLDVPVVQVMIEVEMLDISKVTSDLMGVKFGDTPFSIKGGSREVIYPWNQNELERKGAFTPGSQYTAGKIDATGMSVVLNFLKTRTDTRNLAKPRLMTLNNETAQIKISTNEAIGQTNVEGGQSGNISTQAERVQTGVFLTVTPQVNTETSEILMSVSSKVVQARDGATFGATTYKDPEERGTQSTLVVQNGETIVIGGLLREDDSNTVTKLPILGDLPVVGTAFRHKKKAGTQRELIIFITPHIVGKNTTSHLPPEYQDPTQKQRVLEIDTLLDKVEQSR